MKECPRFSLTQPSHNPITVQLYENDEIPFKVIVQCESSELSLQTMQRPITRDDGLLFSLMSSSNYRILYQEIKDYKAQLKREFEEKREQDDQIGNFEATCKLFLGTQYLGNHDQKRKLQVRESSNQTQQIQPAQNFQDASAHLSKSQSVSQPSAIATNRNPNSNLVNNQSQVISSQKSTLVCAIYEKENLDQVQKFVRSFCNQKVDIIILCNSVKQIEQELKEKLLFNHPKNAFIQKELDQNKYSVNNALVIQYGDEEDFPKVIFIIKYFPSTQFDLQKWVYAGIGKFFDPQYFFITKCSYISVENSITQQTQILNNKDICGVTSNILTVRQTSENPLNPINSFLLNKIINQLENQSINRLFSISMDHDPFFCLYKWNKIKQLIPSYLAQISKSEKDFISNIVAQGTNFILPCIAADKAMYFAKNDQIMAKFYDDSKLANLMEEQRRRNNAFNYSNQIFWKQYNNKQWKMNGLLQNIQIIVLLIRALFVHLDSYFGISAIIFILSQSSYQFFGSAVHFNQDYMLQMVIPSVFIFSIAIFILFTLLFSSVYNIATRQLKPSIKVSGTLVFYITQYKSINTCTIYFDPDGVQKEIKQKDTLLNPLDIKFQGVFPSLKILTMSLVYNNSRYVATKEQSQYIFQQMLNQYSQNQQANKVLQNKKYETIEIFYKGEFENLNFYYENDLKDATEQYSKLFYLLAIQNVILLVIFLTNFAISFFKIFDDTYILITCICFIVIVFQKILLILLNPSHLSMFLKGYLSYLFFYLVVTFGMRFYEMGNTDSNFESKKLKEFYYSKVQNMGTWIICNVVLLFICFMIEAYYNYCGYVLLAFLMYFAIGSVFSIIGMPLSKLLNTTKKKNVETDHTQEGSINGLQIGIQLNVEDFFLEQETQLEQKFLQIQQQANEMYYDLQLQQTRFNLQQIEQSKLFKTQNNQKNNQQNNHNTQLISNNINPPLKTIQETDEFQLKNSQDMLSIQTSQNNLGQQQKYQFSQSQQIQKLMQSNQQFEYQNHNNIEEDDDNKNAMLESKKITKN